MNVSSRGSGMEGADPDAFSSDDVARKEIGERIRAISKKLGSQERLSKAANISETQLRRYIQGVAEPSARKLLDIAAAGDTSVDFLLTGKDKDGGEIAEDSYETYLKDSSRETLRDKLNNSKEEFKAICDDAGYQPSIYMSEMIMSMMFNSQLTTGGAVVLIRALKTEYETMNPLSDK